MTVTQSLKTLGVYVKAIGAYVKANEWASWTMVILVSLFLCVFSSLYIGAYNPSLADVLVSMFGGHPRSYVADLILTKLRMQYALGWVYCSIGLGLWMAIASSKFQPMLKSCILAVVTLVLLWGVDAATGLSGLGIHLDYAVVGTPIVWWAMFLGTEFTMVYYLSKYRNPAWLLFTVGWLMVGMVVVYHHIEGVDWSTIYCVGSVITTASIIWTCAYYGLTRTVYGKVVIALSVIVTVFICLKYGGLF